MIHLERTYSPPAKAGGVVLSDEGREKLPLHKEAWCDAIVKTILEKTCASPVDCYSPPVSMAATP